MAAAAASSSKPAGVSNSINTSYVANFSPIATFNVKIINPVKKKKF